MTSREKIIHSGSAVWGCVLIGGNSSRMGMPKHLIEHNGSTWLEIAVGKLREKVDNVVISGKGAVPASLAAVPVVQDVPELKGPLAGVLAIVRWKPDVSWLVTACDLPDLELEALDWLLSMRRPETRQEHIGHLLRPQPRSLLQTRRQNLRRQRRVHQYHPTVAANQRRRRMRRTICRRLLPELVTTQRSNADHTIVHAYAGP